MDTSARRDENPSTKHCPECDQTLLVTDYYDRGDGRPQRVCKKCFNERSKAWARAHPKQASQSSTASMARGKKAAESYYENHRGTPFPGPQHSEDPPIGSRFGKRVVVGYVPITRANERVFVILRCECGDERPVLLRSIVKDRLLSCRSCIPGYVKHGNCRKGTVADGSVSLAYSSWAGMIQRVSDSGHRAYKHYGGRGITVCARWRVFEHFLLDMGDRPSTLHSLERKENDGGYWCGRCEECRTNAHPLNSYWATPIEQANNKRNNRILEFSGKRLTAAQWARELNMSYKVLMERLRQGWDVERALTTPVNSHQRPKV